MPAGRRDGHPGRRTRSSVRPTQLCADGSLGRARRLYREAIAKDDGDWELWLGLALASEGDAQRRALDRAASLNPLGTQIRQLREQLV